MGTSKQDITALIDGEPVRLRHGSTVLDAAREAGIYLPTLCYLEGLDPYGGCRLCIVDIKGVNGFPTACTTPLQPGMEVRTKTPALQKLRRNILEMTLSEHPYTCLVCKDKKECGEFMHSTRKAGTITGCNFCTSNGDCELQDLIDYLDLKDIKYPISYRGLPTEKSNPFYDLDYNLCILCGRCVRICNEERNSNVLAFVQRGNSSIVGTAFGESQLDAGCEFCGACVDVCPTGSISGKLGKWAGPPDRSTETTCTLCSVGCTINVNTRNGKLVDIGPPPGKRMAPHQICIRGKFLAGEINSHPEKIGSPMIRRNGRLIEVSWDEAYKFVAANLQQNRERGIGVIGSTQDTLEENHQLLKFADASRIPGNSMTGSHSVSSGGRGDRIEGPHDTADPASLTAGYPEAGNPDDLLKSDTLLLLGTDASITHPMIEHRVRKASLLGKTILYANSSLTRTSLFASREIRYADNRDYAFLYILLAELAKKTIAGLPAGLAEQLQEPILARERKKCSARKEDMMDFVSALEKSRRLCILAGGGILQGENEEDAIKAISNIRYLKGESSEVSAILLRSEGGILGGDIPLTNGLQGISTLMVTGDLKPTSALWKLKFLIQMNQFRTELTEKADAFFPVTGFLENEGHFRTVEGKIKRLRKTLKAYGSSKPITEVISGVARAMDLEGFSSSPRAIWKEMQSNDKPDKDKIKKPGLSYYPLKPPGKTGKRKRGTPDDQYLYRGNKLSGLIPDLDKILEE